MIGVGNAKILKAMPSAQRVDESYMSFMVNLTTFAPDIVADILNDTLLPEVALFDLAVGMALLEEEQGAVGMLEHQSESFGCSDRQPTSGADEQEEVVKADEKRVNIAYSRQKQR